MNRRWISITVHIVILTWLLGLPLSTVVRAQQGFSGGAYSQNFDTLANTGTSSSLPTGWSFSESGANADTTYRAGTGSDNTGDTYSYGAASSSERALGELTSGSLISTFGAGFQNTTGSTIGKLLIQYNCEQWRIGDTNNVVDTINFQYSTNASSLSTGAWTDFNALDCNSTDTTSSTGPKDGNTLRTAVSGTITGLSIANNAVFWIRWVGTDISNSDDGLAVDDFSMSAQTPNAITLRTLTAHSPARPWAAALPLLGLVAAGGLAIRRRRA